MFGMRLFGASIFKNCVFVYYRLNVGHLISLFIEGNWFNYDILSNPNYDNCLSLAMRCALRIPMSGSYVELLFWILHYDIRHTNSRRKQIWPYSTKKYLGDQIAIPWIQLFVLLYCNCIKYYTIYTVPLHKTHNSQTQALHHNLITTTYYYITAHTQPHTMTDHKRTQ